MQQTEGNMIKRVWALAAVAAGSLCSAGAWAEGNDDLVEAATQGTDGVRMVTMVAYADDYKAGKLDESTINMLIFDAQKCIKAIDTLLANPETASTKLDLNGVKDLMPIAEAKAKICVPGLTGGNKALAARVDSVEWPAEKNVPNGAKLKAATADWWKKNNKGMLPAYRVENAEIVAVSVRDEWVVGAENEWGAPTRWDVPVWVALTNSKLKAEGLALVFDCSMVTREVRGVKKTTPFYSAVVGTPIKMKLANIPGALKAPPPGKTGKPKK